VTIAAAGIAAPAGYEAARTGLAHRFREAGVLDVEGEGRAAFLQGQLTQDVASLAAGQTRPAAALTAKGKLVFLARVIGLPDRIRLLVPAVARAPAVEHLQKYVVFQKVAISDRSEDFVRIGLHGPDAARIAAGPEEFLLPAEGEFAAELLSPAADRAGVQRRLESAGSVPVSPEAALILRVEAGRPLFGQDADSSHLPDEVGIDSSISTTKGCYVGQEIVARMRTYGRANRRLVGFRFPGGLVAQGSLLKRPEEETPGKIEQGRVTSAAASPRFGAIGLGYAFREVAAGERLVSSADPSLDAIVAALPFA
jgi:folate-binding protein YgfZ